MKTCVQCGRWQHDGDEGWCVLRQSWTNSDRVVDHDICPECAQQIIDSAPKEPKMR